MPCREKIGLITHDKGTVSGAHQLLCRFWVVATRQKSLAALRVSGDPKYSGAWSVCRVTEVPDTLGGPYNFLFCDASVWNGLGEMRFNADTGRFTLVGFGDWHGTKPGDDAKLDSYFNFGVCTPYYD
jgi:hypothetical protein